MGPKMYSKHSLIRFTSITKLLNDFSETLSTEKQGNSHHQHRITAAAILSIKALETFFLSLSDLLIISR